MTTEEMIREQKRYLADFTKRASGSEQERKQAVEESRNRLIAAGILQKDGRISEQYRSLYEA